MIDKKKSITLDIIFSVIGIVFLIFYLDVRETQRHMEMLEIPDPKSLMMNGSMSVQDYCDHFYFQDVRLCDEWNK